MTLLSFLSPLRRLFLTILFSSSFCSSELHQRAFPKVNSTNSRNLPSNGVVSDNGSTSHHSGRSNYSPSLTATGRTSSGHLSAPLPASSRLPPPAHCSDKRETSPLVDRSGTPISRNSTPLGRPPSLSPKLWLPQKAAHSSYTSERISPMFAAHQGHHHSSSPTLPAPALISGPPAAHQNSSPGLTVSSRCSTPQITSSSTATQPPPALTSALVNFNSEDQPQNLVKSEAKPRATVSTSSPSSSFSSSSSSSSVSPASSCYPPNYVNNSTGGNSNTSHHKGLLTIQQEQKPAHRSLSLPPSSVKSDIIKATSNHNHNSGSFGDRNVVISSCSSSSYSYSSKLDGNKPTEFNLMPPPPNLIAAGSIFPVTSMPGQSYTKSNLPKTTEPPRSTYLPGSSIQQQQQQQQQQSNQVLTAHDLARLGPHRRSGMSPPSLPSYNSNSNSSNIMLACEALLKMSDSVSVHNFSKSNDSSEKKVDYRASVPIAAHVASNSNVINPDLHPTHHGSSMHPPHHPSFVLSRNGPPSLNPTQLQSSSPSTISSPSTVSSMISSSQSASSSFNKHLLSSSDGSRLLYAHLSTGLMPGRLPDGLSYPPFVSGANISGNPQVGSVNVAENHNSHPLNERHLHSASTGMSTSRESPLNPYENHYLHSKRTIVPPKENFDLTKRIKREESPNSNQFRTVNSVSGDFTNNVSVKLEPIELKSSLSDHKVTDMIGKTDSNSSPLNGICKDIKSDNLLYQQKSSHSHHHLIATRDSVDKSILSGADNCCDSDLKTILINSTCKSSVTSDHTIVTTSSSSSYLPPPCPASINDSSISKFYPKLKKAWLQRHSDASSTNENMSEAKSVHVNSSSTANTVINKDKTKEKEENLPLNNQVCTEMLNFLISSSIIFLDVFDVLLPNYNSCKRCSF